MSHIRVAPTRSKTNRVFFTLSKWASRYKEKTAQSERKHSTSAVLIESTQARQLASREKVFERQLPFSWLRSIIGIFSLVLVFSDVPRSGLGISSMRAIYPSLQPDEMMGFGTSWNYSVFASSKSDAFSGTKTARVWSYKYDSTSIVWRAFARFLAVEDFPACFFYSNLCPSTTFGGDVAFRMIDGLVDAVSNVKSGVPKAAPGNSIPLRLTLRTDSEYIDRFHQFLLPTWFTNINWRTNQALYYSPELLARKDMHICFPLVGNGAQTPRFCQELWINFDRSCSSTDVKGRSVGLLYAHTLARLHDIQTRFPNLTLDLTFLESQEDMQVARGGLGLLGSRRSDISTIIRARQCRATHSCETLYVQDYRYETGLMTADLIEWYRVVAVLRIIGQSYFILRGIGLMLSCYFVYGNNKSVKKLKALHLFMKTPKQCVVYGSPFPVMCYVFAHLLDAAFMYEMLKGRFITQAGIVNIDLRSFVSYAVIQMRNVWIFSLAWHLVVTLSTSRRLAHSNRLNNGIIGVPSFFWAACQASQ